MNTPYKLVLPLLLILSGVALAQGSGPSPTPSVPGATVPAWVFYWVLGIASFVGVVWASITKILWDRGNRAQDKVSALSAEERGWLKQLHEWHNQKDKDQIPLWYVPRAWLDLIKRLHADHGDVKTLLERIAEQNADVIADLRQQLKDSRGQQAQQQTKMLKLAVRVQRAVEALAGLRPPEIEDVFDEDEEPSA